MYLRSASNCNLCSRQQILLLILFNSKMMVYPDMDTLVADLLFTSHVTSRGSGTGSVPLSLTSYYGYIPWNPYPLDHFCCCILRVDSAQESSEDARWDL